MSVVTVLERLGGSAPRSLVQPITSRRQIERALAGGEVVAPRRGVLALRSLDDGLQRALALNGVLSHESAAMCWGWGVAVVPSTAHVTVRKNLRVPEHLHVHRANLGADEHDSGVTSADRTLLDCARNLPMARALAVADSALRSGFSRQRLLVIARSARGRGAPQVRKVLSAADGLAANPFESVARAHAMASGLRMQPQHVIRHGDAYVVPDLVDESEQLVVECDSFAWHGKRHQLRRDTQRYNWLVAHGWRVLRLSYEDVMFDPDYVVKLFRSVRTNEGDRARGRTQVPSQGVRVAI